jgi:hypothetical protein
MEAPIQQRVLPFKFVASRALASDAVPFQSKRVQLRFPTLEGTRVSFSSSVRLAPVDMFLTITVAPFFV